MNATAQMQPATATISNSQYNNKTTAKQPTTRSLKRSNNRNSNRQAATTATATTISNKQLLIIEENTYTYNNNSVKATNKTVMLFQVERAQKEWRNVKEINVFVLNMFKVRRIAHTPK